MTNNLAALSEAATKGEWLVEEGHIQRDSGGIRYWQVSDGSDAIACNQFCYAGYKPEVNEANAALIVALVNEYRAGRLVSVETVATVDAALARATARAEAAEARNKVLVEANKRTKNAADAILAPLCAQVGRWLIEGKDEPDMIKVAHDYGVVIPVRAFADLYDATDAAALGGEHER